MSEERPRRHRGSRRYVADPTHLPGEAATGDVEGWETRRADREAEAQAYTGVPGHTSADEDPDQDTETQPDDARGAWFRAQRPPHWG